MKIAFYGSSLVSAYWNGAATYYRGLIKALAGLGHEVTFYEPDAYDRQKNRDIDAPEWCESVVYAATPDALREVCARAGDADVVVKASGVGVFDTELIELTMAHARRDALTIFWDVDAPATLAEIRADAGHPLRKAVRGLDFVLTYGGGPKVVAAYEALGARACVPVYNALDPATHHPVAPESRFVGDLAFLGNRLPDREARVEQFFLAPASRLPNRRFLLGGSGWDDKPVSSNVTRLGHVGTRDHNALNCTPLAVLNINRESMAEIGFSPPTRIFEAAGAGACIITDAWHGIEHFLQPNEEILVARDGRDVAEFVGRLEPAAAREMGQRAMRRILADHTYDRRAVEVDRLLRAALTAKRAGAAA